MKYLFAASLMFACYSVCEGQDEPDGPNVSLPSGVGLENGDAPGSPDRSLPPSLVESAEQSSAGESDPDSLPGIANLHGENADPDLRDQLAELYRQLERAQHDNAELKLSLQQAQVERAVAATGAAPEEWANILRSAIWPNRRIRVSWENPTAGNLRGRRLVQRAIERTWERESALDFYGWGPVTANTRDGIRIRIADNHPHCKRLGRHLNNVRDGMVLNFTFRNWCPDCVAMTDEAIEWIAIHEFGHALAFAHEQNRTDAPMWCQQHSQGSDGDWYITIYDPESIMNYCNPRWNNSGRLSGLDVRAVRLLYGDPPNRNAEGVGPRYGETPQEQQRQLERIPVEESSGAYPQAEKGMPEPEPTKEGNDYGKCPATL